MMAGVEVLREILCFVLVLLVWPRLCACQDSFYFSPQPQSQDVTQGRHVTLDCDVNNRRSIVFFWTLNGEPVQNTTRRYQFGSNLYLTRVDRLQDSGEFKCIAKNVSTGIAIASQGAQLNIMYLGDSVEVELHSPKEASQVKVGGEVVLHCKVEGVPEPRVQWFHNGDPVSRDNRHSYKNRRLHLSPVSAEDSGVYSCRASNDAGSQDSVDNLELVVPDENVPKIVVTPKDVTVKKEGSARFDCVYEGAALTEWYGPNGNTPLNSKSSNKVEILANSSLVIRSIQDEDEGLYKCVGVSATNGAPAQTFVAHLKIAYINNFSLTSFEPHVDTEKMIVVPKGKQYEVMCVQPGGHPKPKMWWEDPTGHVVSDTGRIRVKDMMLAIENARKGDSGNYSCVAENIAGQRRIMLQFIVAAPPVITTHPLNVSVEEGESTKLVCEYTGYPYPVTVVRWKKDDKFLRDFGPQNGTLVLRHVGLKDAGEYFCIVNTTGFPPVSSQIATIHVNEKLKFVPPPVSTKLELGSNSKIYCKARGATPPVVRWLKESQGSQGQLDFELPPHIKDENGTLHFNGVRNEDKGRYSCVATNQQGLINTTIQVDVIVMPRFTVQPSNIDAVEGYSAMLHCKASGDPPPTIQWDKNNVLNGFDEKRFVVLENGTLFIKQVYMEDNGKYGCTAGNSGGFKRVEGSLIVKPYENYPSNMSGDGAQEENTMTKTVTITLGAAAIYMMLVMGLMIWCRFRRARRKAMLLVQATAEVAKPDEDGVQPTEMRDKAREPIVRSDGEAQSHSSGSHSHQSKRSRSSYDRLQFPRHDLQTMMLLGRGEFGDVFLAKARGIKDSETETIVMVKALQTRDENAHFEFKKEMDMYHKLNHEGISRLLGLSRDVEPFLVIMEYTDWGDLKQFLLATRKDNHRKGPKPPPLAQAQAIGVCHQVALAMEYLSNHRFTHRDLATRNCLVTSRLDIKVSSPSLSRDTYAQEYFTYQNKVIPLRWTPSEAVFEDDWSTKSDVYSFAVLAWEVFMQAELPQAEKNDNMFLRLLQTQELRWQAPEGVPKGFEDLLQKCWSVCPKERPSFSEIALRIGEIFVDSNV